MLTSAWRLTFAHDPHILVGLAVVVARPDAYGQIRPSYGSSDERQPLTTKQAERAHAKG